MSSADALSLIKSTFLSLGKELKDAISVFDQGMACFHSFVNISTEPPSPKKSKNYQSAVSAVIGRH